MQTGKKNFGLGLIIGIVIASLFFHYFAPRYTTINSGDTLIKQDRWSGDSWRMVDNQWRKISDLERNWGEIDQALRDALNIPRSEPNPDNTLSRLKKRYPILKDVSDEDLLERIKIVYSKEILTNLYLSNYNKIQPKDVSPDNTEIKK